MNALTALGDAATGVILGALAATIVTGAYLVTSRAIRGLRLSSQRARNSEFLAELRAQEEAHMPANELDEGSPPAESSDLLAGLQIASRSGELAPILPDRGASNLIDFRAYWRAEQRDRRAS